MLCFFFCSMKNSSYLQCPGIVILVNKFISILYIPKQDMQKFEIADLIFTLFSFYFEILFVCYVDNLCHSGASCWPFSSYPKDPFGMSPKSSPSLPLPVSKASLSASNGRLGQFLINVLQIFLFLKFILIFWVQHR